MCNNFEISIVIPLFNESKCFGSLIERLETVCESMEIAIEIVLVDDGSTDNTAQLIEILALTDPKYNGVFLARNFGHQIALSAGLSAARGSKAVFILDGDLQDPPELLPAFYTQLNKGYDVIYAVRKNRKESAVKRISYVFFYRILNTLSSIKIPPDSGDFSLISRRVADIIIQMPEESRFLRGMRSWVGFSQIGVEYDRDERQAGNSKYSFPKLWKLAKDGLYNFSEAPVSLMRRLGFILLLFSFIYICCIIYKKIAFDTVPEGFTTIILAIILFSGVQLVFLGLIGEYILRIFFQVKQRPQFIIKDQVADGKKKKIEYGQKKAQAY